ncbi:J domain-containing protein [Xanthomonas maliensis]|uniref:J domain-containing protein n=1 Tax=Xanthomonas maliensis TaxID=1321368 RepID=UPI0003AA6D8E|nr:J domain-containing protein [Xanthomonas maliensis]KAB7770084.1 J domain-containing protein [Xanthomonas maliensis]
MASKGPVPTDLPGSRALRQLQSRPAGDATASPTQRRFERLLGELERQRAELHAWQLALTRWRARYHSQLLPLLERRRVADRAMVELLDRAHVSIKLAKTDRAFLSELLCEIAGPLIDAGDETLRPIYDRHSAVGYDEEVAVSEALMKQAIGQAYGLDAEELDGIDSPEALYERISERLQQQQQARQQRRPQGRKRAGNKAAAASAEPPPLRELYRRLAAALHPDRANDAPDHAHRTGLMQRLNVAYKAGDLLGLLELQAEIGLLDAQGVAAMSTSRLQDYNRELERQCADLRAQLARQAADFCAEYGLELRTRPKPERLDKLLAQLKRETEEELQQSQQELQLLEDPRLFKRWLKQQRSWSDAADAAW